MPATPTLNLLRQTSRNKSCSAKDFRSEIQEYCFWVMNLEAERCSDYMRPHGGTPNSLLERMSLYVAYLNRPYKTCFNTGDDVVRSFCWKLADKVDKKDPKVIQRLRDLGLGVWPNCPRSWRFLNPE